MVERRRIKRLEISIPLSMNLLGTAEYAQPIKTQTRNVSPEGLSIELQVVLKNGSILIQEGEEHLNLIPYLVLDKKEVELDIDIPPQGQRIKAIGQIIWYDFRSRETSYYFRAGIFLKEMKIEDKKKWKELVRNTAPAMGEIWKAMQIFSALIFIVGIVFFIASCYGESAKIAKIGLFFSLFGFIGFIVTFWQQCNFLSLRKSNFS